MNFAVTTFYSMNVLPKFAYVHLPKNKLFGWLKQFNKQCIPQLICHVSKTDKTKPDTNSPLSEENCAPCLLSDGVERIRERLKPKPIILDVRLYYYAQVMDGSAEGSRLNDVL